MQEQVVNPPPSQPNPRVNESEVVTPVRANILEKFLEGYDQSSSKFLVEGISQGFHLNFEGSRTFRVSKNLLSAHKNHEVVNEKLQKEVALGRIMGPFSTPPFQNLQCSPIGLVPKKELNEYRLIHHLSYPFGNSINDFIPEHLCSVSYNTVDDAIKIMKQLGTGCLLAKTDILPQLLEFYPYMLMITSF